MSHEGLSLPPSNETGGGLMRYIILDTKTTGLSPSNGDRIVELSAVEVCDREMGRTFHTFINPGSPIPDAVVRIHGITDAQVSDAPAFAEIASGFLDFIEGGTLVIHNAPFDLRFIVNELALAQLPAIDDMPVIDSLTMARKQFPGQRNSIESLCGRLGIDCKGRESSDGLQDAALLADVFLAMTKSMPDIKPVQTVQDCCADNSEDESGSLQSDGGCMGNNSCPQSIQALVVEAYHDLECLYEGKTPQGIPSGFTDLDALIGRLHPGDLIVLGARPSMGKTALAISMIGNIGLRNHEKPHIAVFSLEMSAKQWVKRMLAAEAKVKMNKLHTGTFTSKDWRNFAHASGLMAEAQIHIYESACTSIQRIIEQCRTLKRDGGLDLVVIDYIQLIDNGAMTLEQVSAVLKTLAEELALPIIALSQLRRCLEDRADKRPILSDIPCFPTLEQHADVVMFLYRHEVYEQKPCHEGMAEIIVVRNRNGATGAVPLTFNRACCRFENR